MLADISSATQKVNSQLLQHFLIYTQFFQPPQPILLHYKGISQNHYNFRPHGIIIGLFALLDGFGQA